MSSNNTAKIKLFTSDGELEGEFDIQVEKESILDAAERQGMEIPSACRSGNCTICACYVDDVSMIDHSVYPDCVPSVDLEEDQVLSCIAGCKSNTAGQTISVTKCW